jgi:predicted nucleotide-binding protein
MKELELLIDEGNKTLSELRYSEREEFQGELVARIRAIHYKGRFLLRKIDKTIYSEYSELFQSTFSKDYNWVIWNIYLRTELEKCIGLFRAINELNNSEVLDKSLRKVFISHGKFSLSFSKLELFIRSLGLIPLYDTNSPSKAKSINSHVDSLLSEADFYIILATSETKDGSGKVLPNHNVIIEYDRLVRNDVSKMVVLLEKDCKMPSMLQDIIYATFSQDSMDEAFSKIASELHKNDLI